MDKYIKKHLITLIVLVFFVLLIIMQLVFRNKYIVLGAFLLLAFALMFGKKEDRILLLVFTLPFSRIFKLDVGYTSFFTIILFEYYGLIVLDYILLKKSFPRKALIPLATFVLLGVYSLLQFVVFRRYVSLTRVLSTLSYMLFPLMFFIDSNRIDDEDKLDIVKFMIFGFIASICIGLLSYVSVRIQDNLFYLIDDKVGIIEGVRRFSGLFGDSNYYGFYTLLIVSILIYHLKSLRPSWLYIGICGFMFAIGFFTLSMMYFIVSIVLLVILFVLLFKSRPRVGFISLLSFSLVLIVIMFIIGDKIMGIIMAKLGSVSSLAEITTGRSLIWEAFIRFFINNPLLLLFGNGINSNASHQVFVVFNNYATHNVVLEILYDFGILGGIIFLGFYILSLNCYKIDIRRSLKNKESWFFVVAFLLCGIVIEIAESDYTPFFLTVFALSLGTLDKVEQVGLGVGYDGKVQEI